MISIALIGGDGAGKTTIAEMLMERLEMNVKYVYMGINIESSNIALPTSRLVQILKRLRASRRNDAPGPRPKSLHAQNKKKKPAGLLWASARLVNRVAEEWYRQCIAWLYQSRGYVTLYDRHFLFDFPASELANGGERLPLPERIHRYCLEHFFPRPSLVLFLDAPPEVLFARKGEASVAYLAERRRVFLQQGSAIDNFHCIDATQPLDRVYDQVEREILQFYGRRNRNRTEDRIERTEIESANEK